MHCCPLFGSGRLVAAGLVMVALAAPARAVIVSTTPDGPNLAAPAPDPGWNNLGNVGGGTGIYLGNRWVLTANHVSGEYLRLQDGRVLTGSVGSNRQLTNAGLSVGPDLRMFRLSSDPGLPSMAISPTSPPVNTQVMMIGSGADRSAQSRGWRLTETPLGYEWTETSLLSAQVQGYSIVGDGPMRWGLNFTSSASMFRQQDATQIFTTTFDSQGAAFEAQATPGDSGGGVFVGSPGGWQLAGVIITTQPLNGQPADTVVYGQKTAIADLSVYRDQILELINRPEPLWQNQLNYYDVDGNGRLSAVDCLALINRLIGVGPSELPGAPATTDLRYDVNGDLRMNAADVIAAINELLRLDSDQQASRARRFVSAAPLAAMCPLPEPSSGMLALAAIACCGLARWLARRPAS